MHNAIYFVANEMGLKYNIKLLIATIATYYGETLT